MSLSDRIIEYQLDGAQFAVVIILDRISHRQAKKIACQRAAEITVMQRDRYFVIDSEEKVEVFKSDGIRCFAGNLYQELIVRDVGKKCLNQPVVKMYPALRLIFTPYLKCPSQNAIDACKLTGDL